MFSNLKDFFIENSETNPLYTLFISPPIANQTFNLLKNQFEFSNDLNLYIHNQKLRSVNLETDSSRKKKLGQILNGTVTFNKNISATLNISQEKKSNIIFIQREQSIKKDNLDINLA